MKPDTGINTEKLLTPDQICNAVSKVMGVSRRGLTIRRTSQTSTWSRRLAMALSYSATPMNQKQLSRFFHCNPSVVSVSYKKLKEELSPEDHIAAINANSERVVSIVGEVLRTAKNS